MKEFNKPEEVIEEKPVIAEKVKRERPYFQLSEDELTDLVNTYRRVLRIETRDTIEMLKLKIEELERELRFRNRLSLKTKS